MELIIHMTAVNNQNERTIMTFQLMLDTLLSLFFQVQTDNINYGILVACDKVKNGLFMYVMYYRQQRTSTLRIWKVCLHSNMYA
jgi:hypothetical protein